MIFIYKIDDQKLLFIFNHLKNSQLISDSNFSLLSTTIWGSHDVLLLLFEASFCRYFPYYKAILS